MKNFCSVKDVENVAQLVEEAIALKNSNIGDGKTVGLVFFNSSLRTRLSMQKAAQNLGMNPIVMNMKEGGWSIEFEEGAIMNSNSQEHVKDMARVMSQYCDIIGVRAFADGKSREGDYEEKVLNAFVQYSTVPVISLESATLHPLQSLADLITIKQQGIKKPKIVVTWAPHPRPLAQAVINSFLEWVKKIEAEVVLTHPKGYELKEEFTAKIEVNYNQEEAFKGADFVYCKSWGSYKDYGKHIGDNNDWTVTQEKMNLTNHGKFMHCLPIRRNVVATDEVIDNSLVYQQAANRVLSAQVVLKKLIEKGY